MCKATPPVHQKYAFQIGMKTVSFMNGSKWISHPPMLRKAEKRSAMPSLCLHFIRGNTAKP